MKIGVYPGSFNPIHKGHLGIIDYLLDKKIVDKVYILPTPEYWDKEIDLDFHFRENMLRLIATDKIIVDTIHSNHEYTYELINEIKKDNLNDELFLIMGADTLIDLDKWEHVDEILNNKVVIFSRDDIDIKYHLNDFHQDSFIIINDFEDIDISSTEIRSNPTKYKDYLDERIYNYIMENNLYKRD